MSRLKVLGIDHGIDNWLTCVSNGGESFIVDGKHLKSLNQWYNKRVARLKDVEGGRSGKAGGRRWEIGRGFRPLPISSRLKRPGLYRLRGKGGRKNIPPAFCPLPPAFRGRSLGQPQGFWSNQLATITEKRNRQMRDAVNKAARLVINYCRAHGIGRIVFGWNQGQKNGANLGRKTNQKFVQVPTAKLKTRLAQLCELYGIELIETEEANTSAASFLDGDSLPKHGEKPEGWKSSGRRVKRGLFRTALNWYINADCNGAANIIRKVAATFGLNLEGVSRGALTSPLRVRLWTIQESPSL